MLSFFHNKKNPVLCIMLVAFSQNCTSPPAFRARVSFGEINYAPHSLLVTACFCSETLYYCYLPQIHKSRNGEDDYNEEPVEAHQVEGAFVDSLL
jgi:hypothetical protein